MGTWEMLAIVILCGLTLGGLLTISWLRQSKTDGSAVRLTPVYPSADPRSECSIASDLGLLCLLPIVVFLFAWASGIENLHPSTLWLGGLLGATLLIGGWSLQTMRDQDRPDSRAWPPDGDQSS